MNYGKRRVKGSIIKWDYVEEKGDYLFKYYAIDYKQKSGVVQYLLCFKNEVLVAWGEEDCQALVGGKFNPKKEKPKNQIIPEETKRAAKDFENLLFIHAPVAKSFINCIDTNTNDDHLIITIKNSLFIISKAEQDSVYEIILDLWRSTKYVREMGYGDWATVKYRTFYNSKETNRDIH